VRRTADAAADRSGNEDFCDVSSHDLRRHFAQRFLVDESVNPRVVISVSGWSSFSANFDQPSTKYSRQLAVDDWIEQRGNSYHPEVKVQMPGGGEKRDRAVSVLMLVTATAPPTLALCTN